MADKIRYGARLRNLRRREGITQSQMATRLGISPSYLNLLEHNQRPLSATLLIRLAQAMQVDIVSFADDQGERVTGELLEVFGDDMFDNEELSSAEVRELVANSPTIARSILTLYHAFQAARASADSLIAKLSDGETLSAVEHSRLPTEAVSDFIQRNNNYFAELEEGAERLRKDARIDEEDLFWALSRYLRDSHQVAVRVERVGVMGGAVRHYDPHERVLHLSEILRRGSRNFQLAHQIGLLTQDRTFHQLSAALPDDVKPLARIALANYFAGATLMPYTTFLQAARAERYDIELLGHRFRTSFEQVCHRLTTLRRPGSEGLAFHLVRIDIAGNISKRFSATGMRFARFSAACSRWNVHAAFMTPGIIRVQLSRMPDGTIYFEVARTLRKDGGGYHSPHAMHAIGLGCDVTHARELVYADGVDLNHVAGAVPVGITCRLCERTDCELRALPSVQHPLKLDENIRGVSFYAPVNVRTR